MKLFLDVGYYETVARAIGVLLKADGTFEIIEKEIKNPAPYVPGEFYKRELPCLLEVINATDKTQLEWIVVDGYVYTDNDRKPGLGSHLYNALHSKVPIIGVAKTFYRSNENTVLKVVRGDSQNPLHVSAIGIELEAAADIIRNMSGPYRIPDMIKKADTLTRQKLI